MTQPIHEQILAIMADVPPDELEKLPVDGAANLDSYLYGGGDMSKDDGGPAFPVLSSETWHYSNEGMSLRDWFAGQALHSMTEYASGCENLNATIATACYDLADAMIAARNQRSGES